MLNRRDFIKGTAALSAGSLLLKGPALAAVAADEPAFKISLAEWSLHKALFAKQIDHLDFARLAKQEFGIEGLEYVNQFFMDKAKDQNYLNEMKTRADGEGVKSPTH